MNRKKILDILGDAFSIAQAFLDLLHTLNDKEDEEENNATQQRDTLDSRR